jgi:putative mycofactocin binding protein MftB
MPITLDTPYRLHERVALRPEPFGAHAYHYDNRRLVFLRSPDMVRVVEALAGAPDLGAALDEVGIAEERRAAFVSALEDLEHSEVICARR